MELRPSFQTPLRTTNTTAVADAASGGIGANPTPPRQTRAHQPDPPDAVAVRYFCARCAKFLAKDPALVCKKRPGAGKCTRCTKQGSKCEKVPERLRPALARLQDKASNLPAAGRARTAAGAALAASAAAFGRRFERALKRTGKKGDQAKAMTPYQVTPAKAMTSYQRAKLREMGALRREVASLNDAYRAQNKLPAADHGSDDDSSSSEEGENEDEDDDDDEAGGA